MARRGRHRAADRRSRPADPHQAPVRALTRRARISEGRPHRFSVGQIRRKGERGKGMAVAGSVLSGIGTALWVLV
ncbi:DUF4190 domain-containing protein, partial [Streptomyces griseoviridis]|uniref:DUF4190 domain-containing protein n=1 Tax=Streptomyces griseoviridis TaxID=45398 RepID=UPI00344FFDC9